MVRPRRWNQWTSTSSCSATTITSDNLDHLGRQALSKARTLVTTVGGAGRLGGNAIRVEPWKGVEIDSVRITGTPARHGPEGKDSGPVTGFVLTAEGEPDITNSGDTLLVGARPFPNAVVVPVHFEGWRHHSECREQINLASANAGLGHRLKWAPFATGYAPNREMGVKIAAMNVNRRSVLLAGASLTAAFSQDNRLKAGDVVERIRKNVGVDWRSETVDKIVAGSADVPVKGIATTMMATLEVLQRAAAAGRNMVITHEPTFYNHQDSNDGLVNTDVYQFKAKFIQDHGMAVFRFHDHWHARHPDGINAGMTAELGWEKNADAGNPRLFKFSGIPLAEFAAGIQSRLKAQAVRVIGDPRLPVNRVLASWGYVSQGPGIANLARPDVDVMIGGEAREWEVIEYAGDAVAAGKKKGFIVLGHIVSEQAGMKHCADWLKTLISEVPVEFIAAREPFWRPDHPVTL